MQAVPDADFKMLDYSPYFIIDAFNDGGHKPIDIKTPFGKLSDQSLNELDRYCLNVVVKKKDPNGYTYSVSRKKQDVK